MIQRMGRILRLKQRGVGARFVVLYASDTLEDPTASERDGFMEEIEAISESARIFGIGEQDELVSFLNYFGPDEPVVPEKIGPMTSVEELPNNLDAVDQYAWLNFLGWPEVTDAHEEAWTTPLSVAPDPAYLDFDVLELPEIARQKTSPKKEARLSTGEQPVTMSKVDGNFLLRCTGCGAASEPTPFRWKALEATVECSCLW